MGRWLVHRRGWGSADAALARGRIDAQQAHHLLARHPLDGGPPIYAVDATCWARCDANCRPQRGGRSPGRPGGSRSGPATRHPTSKPRAA
jgi:hypothetical protein